MKCPHCDSTWTVSAKITYTLHFCPFCGGSLRKKREFPANAVCRPEDYQTEDHTPVKYTGTPYVRILKKYTGSDRVITIPQGIISIDTGAFSSCGLWEAYLPDGLEIIGFFSFKGCHLLRKISFPDSLTVIADSAFEGCFSLEEIEIPGSVQKICRKAFWFCMNLTHVKLCEGVKRIDAEAFAFCNRMSIIEIPDSLEEIHPTAIHCSEKIQVIASESWKKAHPDLLKRFYYIHAGWDNGRP